MSDRPCAASFESWNERMIRRYDPDAFHHHPSAIVRFIEGRRVDTLLRLLDIQPQSRVLDVGCGAGNVLERVRSVRRHGIDISDYALQKARARLGTDVELRKARAEELPYPDRSFDRLYCTEVLEHVLDPRTVLAEMRRVLRDDGVAVVTVPNERLINRMKNIVFSLGPVGRFLLQSDAGGYRSSKRMDEEWHLHAFDRSMLRECVAPYFAINALVGVPAALLPLRFVARLHPL